MVQSIVFKLGGIVFIFLIFVVVYSCIGVHLLMQPFEVIQNINIRSAINSQRMIMALCSFCMSVCQDEYYMTVHYLSHFKMAFDYVLIVPWVNFPINL